METKSTTGKWEIYHWSKGDSGVQYYGFIDGVKYFKGDAVNEDYFGVRSKVNPYETNIEQSFEGAHIADINCFSANSKEGQCEAVENAKLIALAGNLAQLYDPSTWQSKLAAFDAMKEALEAISGYDHSNDDDYFDSMVFIMEMAREALQLNNKE